MVVQEKDSNDDDNETRLFEQQQQSLLIGWLDCWLVGWIVHVPLRWGNRQVIEDDRTNE